MESIHSICVSHFIFRFQGPCPSSFHTYWVFSLVHYYQEETVRVTDSADYHREKVLFTPVAQRTRAARLAARDSRPHTPTPTARGESSLLDDVTQGIETLDLGSQTPALSSASQASVGVPESLSPTSPISAKVAKLFQSFNDEQIVNTALILFLNALSMRCDEVTAHWTLQRQSFTVGIGNETVYEARVDGFLRSPTGDVKAIIEVKPCVRSQKSMEIRMQETAQMAAWICSHPPDVHEMRREGRKER
jgi:hypothetical protein